VAGAQLRAGAQGPGALRGRQVRAAGVLLCVQDRAAVRLSHLNVKKGASVLRERQARGRLPHVARCAALCLVEGLLAVLGDVG
jgi:hypothetical protein